MTKPKLVILDAIELLPPGLVDQLSEFTDVQTFDQSPVDTDDAAERCRDAEIVISRWVPMPESLISECPNLRLIISAASGYNTIDLETVRTNDILLCHCPGHNALAVAEHAIGLMLAAARQTIIAASAAQSDDWHPQGFPGRELTGKVIGIVGFGNIGRGVAKIAEGGFGMQVMTYDIDSTRADLEELLRSSDYIVTCLPLNDDTANMFGLAEFGLMNNAVFVNVGRGGVVDEDALVQALDDGNVAAAAVDVLADESDAPSSPLVNHPKVTVTPHIAFNTSQTEERLANQIVEIVRGYQSESPIYIVPELQ